MTSFDPFTATMFDAMNQPDACEPGGAVSLWYAAQSLKHDRAVLEQNPLDGVALCITAGFAIPDWLGDAFLQRYKKVVNFEVPSLDDAFPPSTPRTKNELPPNYAVVLALSDSGRQAEPDKSKEHLSTRRLRRMYGLAVHELFNYLPKLPRTLAGRQEAAKLKFFPVFPNFSYKSVH